MDTDTRNDIPDGAIAHTVRFYADDAVLMREVVGFLEAALAARGAAIVIATPGHRAAIRRQLGDPGAVRFLDAERTLARLLRDGWPDEARLRAVMAPLLQEASAGAGPVHLFGEMAALLCAQGCYQAALCLEQLLDGLAGGTLIIDGATNRSFSTRAAGGATLRLTLPARGGFVVQP